MQQFKIFKDKFSKTLASLGTRWTTIQNLPGTVFQSQKSDWLQK